VSISRIYSYLVHAAKHEHVQPPIGGVQVQHQGKLFDMLSKLDTAARSECDIDIVFDPAEDGTQQNDCRDALLRHLQNPGMASGRAIASRLQRVTTRRSGMALVFVITGRDQHGHRLLISRFPAETGVMAEEHGESISVEFVEKVFMKNSHTYKCAFFEGASMRAGFWDGRVVDRQMIDTRGSADYWVREFLLSALKNTAAAGTKRVAVALQAALRMTTNAAVRQELVGAAQMMRGHKGRLTSAKKLIHDLGLSSGAATAIEEAFPRPELFDATFKFDRDEFEKEILFRSEELDNGVVITAPDATFDSVVTKESKTRAGTTRFTTEGTIVSARLKKTK
jgi:hypothetical protein